MFNKILGRLMEEHCMNQKELSEKTKISRAAISQYLSGKNEPAKKNIEKIANVFGVTVEYFEVEPKQCRQTIEPVKVKNVTPEDAAKMLGKGVMFVRRGLQQGTAPFGHAVRGSGNNWEYHISYGLLKNYINGG